MRFTFTFLMIACEITLSFSQDVYQLNRTNGPYGGLPLCMVMKNNILFVGTNCGVVATVNDGATWELRSDGIPNSTEIRAIVELNGRLICCTSNNGVFISNDDGISWINSSLGLPSLVTYNLLVNGMDLLLSSQDGIFKSSNFGSNWTFSGIGIPSNIGEHEFTTFGSLIFLTNGNYGVFKSNDAGLSWSSSNTGLPSSGIGSISAAGSSLLVTTTDGLYISNNSGSSWSQSTSNLPVACWNLYNSGNAIYCNAADGFGLSNSVLTGGLYKSSNNGSSWTQISAIKGCAFEYYNSKLYVASQFLSSSCQYYINNGVYLATSNETTWRNIGLGKANIINDMLMDGPSIFACTDNGIYRSNNQGETWNLINSGLPLNVAVTCITKLGSKLFIGTYGDGVFSTSNDGVSWVSSNAGLTVPDVTSSVFDFHTISAIQSVGNDLYLGGSSWPFCTGSSAPAGKIFKSTNQGVTWIDVSNGVNDGDNSIYLSDIISVGPAILVCDNSSTTGFSQGNIFLTTNGGTSWVSSSSGLPVGGVSEFASDGTYIYASGIEYDNFGNSSWGEVYYSSNYGTSWTSMNLPDYYSYEALLVDGSTLFIGSGNGSSIYSTNNQGMTLNYYQGVDGYVTKLVGNSGELYAGTRASSNWWQPTGVYSYTSSGNLVQFSDEANDAIFSNPFQDALIILGNYGLSNCSYSIYELSGALVMEGYVLEGRISNLGALSNGLYIIKLNSDDNLVTAKILKQ